LIATHLVIPDHPDHVALLPSPLSTGPQRRQSWEWLFPINRIVYTRSAVHPETRASCRQRRKNHGGQWL